MGNLIDYEYKPTVGEAVSDLQSIAAGAVLTIRPASGVTWMIETLIFSGAVRIDLTDETNVGNISTEGAASIIEKAAYRITHEDYITMTNTTGGALIYGYQGYVVEENI